MRSDTQLCILTAASQEQDLRAYPFPANLTGDTDKAARNLVASGLLEYAPPSLVYPAWRRVQGRGNVSLRITKRGLTAINIED